MNKVESAIKILRIAEQQAKQYNEPVEIAYSGGKDSDVLLQLAKEAEINYRAIYKNTTIDPKGTIQHVRENGVEIWQPRCSFFEIVKQNGYPSRWSRFCCHELKEYKILNVCAIGVRTEESVKRKKIYTTFEKCRVFSKTSKVHQYSPIYDWTLRDVADFITDRNLRLAANYYTPDGTIDFTRRLGCMGCPLRSDQGKGEFKAHPNLVKAWLRAGAQFLASHQNSKSNLIFGGDVYNMFFAHLFCKHVGEYQFIKTQDLWGESFDTKKFLQEYFNIKLP